MMVALPSFLYFIIQFEIGRFLYVIDEIYMKWTFLSRSCGAVPRLPGYKLLVFPLWMYSAFPELRRKPLKSYRISCFRMVAVRERAIINGENQPNSVKTASKPMTDHGRYAFWFPLVKQISRKIFVKGRTKRV